MAAANDATTAAVAAAVAAAATASAALLRDSAVRMHEAVPSDVCCSTE